MSQCADCDGGFFVDQKVVVVGGGDSALQEALHLADYASEITIVTRGNNLRARQSYVTRAAENPKFSFRWETTVAEIVGDGVEGVRLVPAVAAIRKTSNAPVFSSSSAWRQMMVFCRATSNATRMVS